MVASSVEYPYPRDSGKYRFGRFSATEDTHSLLDLLLFFVLTNGRRQETLRRDIEELQARIASVRRDFHPMKQEVSAQQ